MSVALSVIVCTYNRCESLRDTLRSLNGQILDHGLGLEIIVVDNNSSDDTRQVVEEAVVDGLWPVRCVFEGRQGLSYARNCGLREACGEIVAFTDDDIIADSHWVQGLVDAFEQHQADAVGGRIEPLWLSPPPEWLLLPNLRQSLWPLLALLECEETLVVNDRADQNFLFGASMAFRKAIFTEIGIFRTDLGRVGKNLFAGDDAELFHRLLKAGKRIVYTSLAVVRHKVPSARMRMAFIRQRKFDGGRTLVRMLPERYGRISRWLVQECLSNGLRALLAYIMGQREVGITRDMLFWAQLGLIVETVKWRWRQRRQSV